MNGTEAVTFLGERSSDGYWLCLALPRNSFCFIPGEREACMIEFRGPRKAFDKHLGAVKAAVQTFDF